MILNQIRTARIATQIAALAIFCLSGVSEASSRQVVVNGTPVGAAELMVLDALNCGNAVPNGHYWLNVNTGAWGFQGGPQAGVLGSGCRASAPRSNQNGDCASKYRFHEDRMCYCYHVC